MSWQSAWLSLPRRLRAMREEAGMTQAALAAELGISERQMSRLETSECDVSSRVLHGWADALGCRIEMTKMSGPQSEDEPSVSARLDAMSEALRAPLPISPLPPGAISAKRRSDR